MPFYVDTTLIFLFVAIKKRVEALDKEEKELDLRLKQLQMKGTKIKLSYTFDENWDDSK